MRQVGLTILAILTVFLGAHGLLFLVNNFVGGVTHGMTIEELRIMVEACESNLPRHLECHITAVANE